MAFVSPTSVVNSVTFPLDKVFASSFSATMIQNTFNFIFVLSLNNKCRWFVKDKGRGEGNHRCVMGGVSRHGIRDELARR